MWGGHRLWAAPEAKPRSYWPDNDPVEAKVVGAYTVRLIPPFEENTHIQKEMIVKLDPSGTGVTVTHKITNRDLWPIELAPWALTIVRGQVLRLSRRSRSNLTRKSCFRRARWYCGVHRPQRSAVDTGQEVRATPHGWRPGAPSEDRCRKQARVAGVILREKTLFIKRFPYIEGATYPDYGCNFETFTVELFMEVESVAPLTHARPRPERVSRGEVVPVCQRRRRRDG